jgi:hypothetical protein
MGLVNSIRGSFIESNGMQRKNKNIKRESGKHERNGKVIKWEPLLLCIGEGKGMLKRLMACGGFAANSNSTRMYFWTTSGFRYH